MTLHLERVFLAGCLLLLTACQPEPMAQTETFQSEQHTFTVDILVDGLDFPWGLAFMPDGDMLVTQRPGALHRIDRETLQPELIAGLPAISEIGQGGLMGITLHPEFSDNRLVYLAYTGEAGGRYGTEVLRGRLEGNRLASVETIFRALPKENGGRHFGSRLLFAPDGTLFVTLGDRGASPSLGDGHPAQQLDSHLGSLIRINADGSVPPDNPFVNRPDARPENYTLGNRNMQGITLHPETHQIWAHEHGPQGGDEVNIMRPGDNYGWPVITYGVNYGIGTQIGVGTHKPGMEQPVHKWVPSIAPSGMTFYTGDQFPEWRGDLFVGSLKFGLLVRLDVQGNEILSEERMLDFSYGRIRDVVQGPDGHLYLLTDDADGKLLKVSPAF